MTLSVLHRDLNLDTFDLPSAYGFEGLDAATLNDIPIGAALEKGHGRLRVRFSPTLEMSAGDRLVLDFLEESP